METPPCPVPESSPGFLSGQVSQARRYHFGSDPVGVGSPVVVVCGGCERADLDYVVDRADFPFHVVECVAEGGGALRLAGADYRLGAGVAYAYGPGVAHRIRSDPARPLLKYYVVFGGEGARPLLEESVLGTWRAVQVPALHEVAELFETLQREGSAGGRLRAGICGALLQALIMKISQDARPHDGAACSRALETFQRAKRLMQERFTTLRSAEEAAAACHIDRTYLSRLFQRYAATTPYRFLLRLKIDQAARRLLDGRLLVKEVADELGFADAYHFSRAFKRVYGVSPEGFARPRTPAR